MDTDTRHEFEPLAGDDVCMYVLSNGNRCMKFEGEHAPTKIDADLAQSDANLAEGYAWDAIDFALAAVDEAEAAVLDAMYARANAIALSS